jgi:predicted nucleic acid-binding protein
LTVASSTAAGAAPFLDTNILLYLLSSDAAKADRAEALLQGGATVGVQVLNEFASVASRRLALSWPEIEDILSLIRHRCEVRALTLEVHEQALALVQRHGFAWYDALIVAAAQDAGCALLYSEDMQHRMRVGDTLTIVNPFVAPAPGKKARHDR